MCATSWKYNIANTVVKISNGSCDGRSQSLRPARAARPEAPATGGAPEAACVHDGARRRGGRPLDGLAGRAGGCRRRGRLRLLRWTRSPHRQLPEARGPAAQAGVRTRAPRLPRQLGLLIRSLYFSLRFLVVDKHLHFPFSSHSIQTFNATVNNSILHVHLHVHNFSWLANKARFTYLSIEQVWSSLVTCFYKIQYFTYRTYHRYFITFYYLEILSTFSNRKRYVSYIGYLKSNGINWNVSTFVIIDNKSNG